MCLKIIYNAHLKGITLFNAEPLCSWWHHSKEKQNNVKLLIFNENQEFLFPLKTQKQSWGQRQFAPNSA